MNGTMIRAGIVVLVAIVSAGCAAHRNDQRQTANDTCEYPDTMTCEEFAGELFNCICANEDDMRRMFEVLRNQ